MRLRAVTASENCPHIMEARGLWRIHSMDSRSCTILTDVSLSIAHNDFISVVGPSGSGKSTLLGILGMLDTPTMGDVLINGDSTAGLPAAALAKIRASTVGFVFQSFCLLPRLSSVEQLLVPALYGPLGMAVYRKRAAECLEAVGLAEYASHAPHQLSGGQKQRIAIARALMNRPRVILADEPTGALDQNSGAAIVELLSSLNEQGIAVVIVTHDESVASQTKRLIRMCDGKIVSDSRTAEGSVLRAIA